MQVVAHDVDEVLVARLARVGQAGALDERAHRVDDVVHVLHREEAGDVARGEQVVHVDEEALVGDLAVGEDEGDALALEARLAVHDLQVGLEVVDAVARGDDHLEGRVAVDEGREPRERLLAHAAHAHHERVPAGALDDARDAADVAHRVLEEHEVHRGVGLVVLVERAREQLGQPREVLDPVVDLVADALREVAEDERLGEEDGRRELVEELLGLLHGEVLVLLQVAHAHEPVAVGALRLVQPELRHLERVLQLRGLAHEHALEDARDVAHVELVVEVGGRLAEGAGDALVQLHGRLHELLADLLHLLVELAQVAEEEGLEDGVERVDRREADGEGGEAALQPRVDDEGAGGGVHRGEVLRVEQHLLAELVHVVDVAVAHVLPHERQVGGGAVRVERGHVEVVDEVDHLLVAGRAEVLARLLLERRLDDLLVHVRVGVVVDVDIHARVLLGQRAQLAVDERRLAAAGRADEHRAVLVGQQVVEPEGGGDRLHGGHGDERHLLRRAVELELGHDLAPRQEVLLGLVDEDVVDLAAVRELDRLPRVLPVLRELLAVVRARGDRHGAAEGPHGREDEVDLERRRVLDADVVDDPQALQEVEQRLDHAELEQRHDVRVVHGDLEQHGAAVLLDELLRLGLHLLARLGLDLQEGSSAVGLGSG